MVSQMRRIDMCCLTFMLLITLVYSAHAFAWPRREFSVFWDLGMQNLAFVLAAAGAWRRWWTMRADGTPALMIAFALSSYTVANLIYSIIEWRSGDVSFPSIADIGYLGFYGFAVVAVITGVVGIDRSMRLATAVEIVLGAVAAATLTAIALEPVLHMKHAPGSSWTAVLVGVAYPFLDVVLMAFIAVLVAAPGARTDFRWSLVVLGMSAFAAADVIYARREFAGGYQMGTSIDALSVLGCTMMAMGTWIRAPSTRSNQNHVPRPAAALVPVGAIAVLLLVLLFPSLAPDDSLARRLSVMILLTALVRSVIAHMDLRRLVALEDIAAIDPLTGLHNRRFADGALEVMRQMMPRGGALFVAVIDLDDFKHINDSLGHAAGDQALMQLADAMRAVTRDSDLLARMGGDEFLIATILDQTPEGTARDFAERLGARLNRDLEQRNRLPQQVRFSLGFACTRDEGATMAELLEAADARMFVEKELHHRMVRPKGRRSGLEPHSPNAL